MERYAYAITHTTDDIIHNKYNSQLSRHKLINSIKHEKTKGSIKLEKTPDIFIFSIIDRYFIDFIRLSN